VILTDQIRERRIMPAPKDHSPETARSILQMNFPSSDQDRVDLLPSRAPAGTLTSNEREELESYARAADLLAILQSEARLSLKQRGILRED
jgi:hypothetical protein